MLGLVDSKEISMSHKRGHNSITKGDASDYVIYNPATCNRNYGTTATNYSTFGGYYIIEYY
jgi:hypothetical protein